jgi:hypothetical protein
VIPSWCHSPFNYKCITVHHETEGNTPDFLLENKNHHKMEIEHVIKKEVNNSKASKNVVIS